MRRLDKILPGTGRRTTLRVVEGAPGRLLSLPSSCHALGPLHRASHGPPPRTGEDPA